jgi:hypothetical protein
MQYIHSLLVKKRLVEVEPHATANIISAKTRGGVSVQAAIHDNFALLHGPDSKNATFYSVATTARVASIQ